MVRAGYKQTEVGEIPVDWDFVQLGSCAISEGGYAFSSSKFLSEGDYQVIKMSNLYGGTLRLDRSASFLKTISKLEAGYLIKESDILITLTGTVGKTDYGYSYRIRREKNLLLNQRVARIVVDGNVSNPALVGYLCKTPAFFKQFFNLSKGGTGNQTNVSTTDLLSVYIPVPKNKNEQKAIAKALSDVDELIASLEKLIAKKRDIKTATMQQLLTGKKRLPGFGEGKGYKQTELGEIPEDWNVKPIGDLLRIRHGKSQKEVFDPNGDYPILATGGEIGRAREPLYSNPSVLIGRKGTIDIPYYMDTPFWTVDTLFYSEVYNNADAKFMFYKFLFIDWYQYNEASGVPSLNAATIEKIIQAVPSTKEEQSAISGLLTGFDTEIKVLESRLNKTKDIKQGMMQELLTGRTRLI